MTAKNKIWFANFVVLIIFLFVVGIYQVSAQTTTVAPTITSSATTPGKRANPTRAGAGAANKNVAKQQIVTRVAALTNRMLDRANDALLRLDGIWARVLTRIDKFKAAGKDVSSLAGWIQQVQDKRKLAADAIEKAKFSLITIDISASPKNDVKSFINLFKEVKKALKDYHESIKTVITNIKGMSGQTGVGPSVIPSITLKPNLTASPPTSVPVNPTLTSIQSLSPTAPAGP